MTTIARMLAVMALTLAASLAQAQNKVPSERALEALVKTTLLTFNDANVTVIPSDGEWKLIRINVKVDSPP